MMPAAHICGEAAQAATANRAHYQWHRYHQTTPCPKARAEATHYAASREGRGEEYEYRPRAAKHECGERPSHHRNRTGDE